MRLIQKSRRMTSCRFSVSYTRYIELDNLILCLALAPISIPLALFRCLALYFHFSGTYRTRLCFANFSQSRKANISLTGVSQWLYFRSVARRVRGRSDHVHGVYRYRMNLIMSFGITGYISVFSLTIRCLALTLFPVYGCPWVRDGTVDVHVRSAWLG